MSIAAIVEDLHVSINTSKGDVDLVSDLTFSVRSGETVALVGESGCGKSITALALMRLLPEGGPRVTDGSVSIGDVDIFSLSQSAVRQVRGRDISMIFQDPMGSLNPVTPIGEQLVEGICAHENVSRAHAVERALDLLHLVAIPDPERRFHEYPHRLSGGMCQRVLIAMAIACNPRVLIADEPTTALDVTIQAQILALLRKLQSDTGMAMLFITHDLGVVAEMASRVIVMYAGRKVEDGPVEAIFSEPLHPYTQGLIASTLTYGGPRQERLREIPGMVPGVMDRGVGCTFADRCPSAMDHCRRERPELTQKSAEHHVACWLHGDAQ
jgi:peptide/nickel transport system ATP-binding protein